MVWIEPAIKYRYSSEFISAEERGVLAVVAGHAEVYCLECASGMDLLVSGEVFANTEFFTECRCDSCYKAIAPRVATAGQATH